MDGKFLIGSVVVVAVLGILMVSADASQTDYNVIESNVTLNVSLMNPVSVHKLTDTIKTRDYYRGYDNETLKWFESLKGKYAFYGENKIVIMDKDDADKIPSPKGMAFADVDYYEIFSCDVLENRSLVNAAGPDDVLLVSNVTYITEDAYYYEV